MTEGYRNVFAQVGTDGLPYPAGCADEGTRNLLDSEIPSEWAPPGDMLTRYGEFVKTNAWIGMENLRLVHEAGITVALGTDAGKAGYSQFSLAMIGPRRVDAGDLRPLRHRQR